MTVQVTEEVTRVVVADTPTVVQIADDGVPRVSLSYEDTDVTVQFEQPTKHVSTDQVTVVAAPTETRVTISDGFVFGGDATPGTTFLARPELKDDTPDAVFYFGWENVSGGWAIQRQPRLGGPVAWAQASSNAGIPDLTTAWPQRETLTYG